MSGRTLARAESAAKTSGGSPYALAEPERNTGANQATDTAHDDATSPALTGDFAWLTPHGPSRVVLNGDEARTFLTNWLLQELAPALGLDPSTIDIHVDDAAAARTNAHGASGVFENGRIFLHPDRYRPAHPDGRRLLAHEVVHAVQAQRRAVTPVETPAARQGAEREAEQVARAFAARATIPRVVRPIAPVAAAADADFDAKLAAAVVTGRAREIDAIRQLLSGWWISDGDVFGVFKILEGMAFPVARAVVHALGRTSRYELCDNINTVHLQRNRTMVFACYDALDDNQFSAVDTSVLESGPMGGLEGEERDAAIRTILHLSSSAQRRLRQSANGRAISALFASSGVRPQSAQDLAAIAKRNATLLEAEQTLAVEREEIAKLRESEATKGIVEQIRDILNGESSPHLNAQHAVEALSTLQGAQLTAVAESLDAEGLIDLIFAHLPEWAFFGERAHTETLLSLMQSRLPSKNLDYVESLLSYGFFDWAVRDYEAKFAYRILKLLPLSAQYRFRKRDNGKWFMRLVQNLPDDFKKTKNYQGDIEVRKATREEIEALQQEGLKGVDPQERLVDVSALHRARRNDPKAGARFGARIDELKKMFADAADADNPGPAYEEIHRQIAVTGEASLVGRKFTAADQILLEIVVHELDRDGYIDTLFSELSDRFLYSEVNRITTVKIMMARDPARVQYHARELVSRGFTDWMVTDREAYLAYLCVKGLPDEEREAFVSEDSDAWGEILGEMSRDARESSDLNMYVGDREGTDRGSVLAQLADKSIWTGESAAKLDGLLRMAVAMTEHRFAFDRSQEFKAYASESEDVTALVTKYALYDPNATPPRTKYTPNILKGTKWYEEGIFATLRTIWAGLVFLFNNDLLLFTRSAGAVNLNLNELQDVFGGDIKGAKLADPERTFQGKEPNPNANKVTVKLDIGAHAAMVSLPELRIESVSMQAAGQTIQTGSIHLKGLEISATYDTDDLKQPTHAHLTASSLELRDMLVAFRTSMIAVSRFFLTTLRVGAGVTDTITPGGATARDGYYLPVPFLATIASLIYYLFKLKGWGTDTPDTEMGRGVGQIRAMDLTFASLEVDGFQTSGGQSVGKLKITDFALRIGLTKTTALRAKMDSLLARIKRLRARGDTAAADALQRQYEDSDKALRKLLAGEARMLEIQQILLHEEPSVETEKALQNEIDAIALESAGGVYIDMGSLEASGISGTVTAKDPIKLNDLHGEGTSPAMAAGLGLQLLTPEKLRQIAKGEKPKSLAEMGGELRIDLGDFRTGELSIGGGIRTSKQIEEKLKELEPKKDFYEFAPLYEHLTLLQGEAVRHEQYLAVGVSSLTREQLDDFRRLREILAKEPDIVFGSIDLIQAHLDLDPTGGIGIGAKEATLKNIRLPERGIRVDEVKALDLDVKANAKGGLAGWLDAKRNIQGGALTAESLTISGAHSDFHGLLLEKLTLTGREAGEKLDVRVESGNTLRIGLSAKAEGLGLVPRIGLMKQRLDGLRKQNAATPSAQTSEQIKELETGITELTALADTRAKAWALIAKAKTPDEKAAAKQALLEAEGIIAYGLKQYSAATVELEGFGVQAEGAGDILSEALGSGFDPMSVLEGGVSVKGTGPDNRLFRRFAVTGAQMAEHDPAHSATGGAAAFEVGETKVSVSAKKTGDSIVVDVPQFEIASISLSQFLFTSDDSGTGVQLWSTGQSGLDTVAFKGSLRLDAKTAGSRNLSDFRIAHVRMDALSIKKIYANGLGFSSLDEKLTLDLKSGSVNNLTATNLTIDIPADASAPLVVAGRAGVGSITDLDIGKAVVGAYEVTKGRINARQIDVGFFEDGGIEASLGDLSLQSFALRGPDGWAHFSLSHLSGRGSFRDGVVNLEDVRLGSFEVSSIHWKMGAKGVIEATKPAKVEGVRLRGRLETEQVDAKPKKDALPGAKPEKETRLKKAKISEFHVDSITGEHLAYQDEENRVEIKPWDPSMPAHLKTFAPLFIRNVNVVDLEWEAGKEKGFVAGKVDVEKYGVAAHYEGLKSGMKAGLALRGGGLNAEIVGAGTLGGSLGKIEHVAGYYNDKNISTKFASGAIIGNFAVGPDFVELSKIEVDGLFFGKSTYTDLPSRKLELKRAMVEKIAIGKVRQNYAKSTEPGKEGERVPTTLDVEDLVLTDISAGGFVYDGQAEGKNDKGEKTSSTQHVEASRVGIDRLTVSRLSQNKATQEITASFKVDSRKTALPAISVHGLVANMASKVGDKETITKIAAEVDGGPLTGENITFGTVDMKGTTIGPDGKEVPVTRSTVKGKFQLDRLRLWSPEISIAQTGQPTVIISKDDYARDSAKIELKGVKPEVFSNGAAHVPFDSVTAENLKVVRDGVTIRIPFAEIKDIALGLRGQGTEEGMDWLAARFGQINVKGLSISMQVERQGNLSEAEYAAALKKYQQSLDNPEPKDLLIVEPLAGLSGEAEGEVAVAYIPDPDITVKIQDSILQMSDASIFALYVRPDHVGIGNFGVHNLLSVDFDSPMPGFHEGGKSNWKSWPFDRGYINIKEMVEGLYNSPPGKPSKTGTDLSFLNRLNFEESTFRLGSGRAGLDKNRDQKLGDGDFWLELQRTEESQNVVRLLKSNIGEKLRLQMDTFRAGSAGFAAGKTQKGTERLGKTGPITLKGINVTVSGLAEFSFRINAYVREGTIEKVEIGDLKFLDKANLAALPAPTLSEVNSKATPLPAGSTK